MRCLAILVAALAGLSVSPAAAQSTYPTPAGTRVNGVVNLVCDATGANCAPAGTTAAGSDKVQGDVAAGATDAGNPVKIGGEARGGTSYPAYTDGQRGNAIINPSGMLYIAAADYDGTAGSDGRNVFGISGRIGYGGSPSPVAMGSYVFNGSGWDRARGDTTGSYVVGMPSAASAAGTVNAATTVASSELVAKASAGNLFGFNVTSAASAGYVLVFNATSAPADGTVTPARCIPLAANTGIDVNLRAQPTFFSTGITIVFSTTGCFTKTASATAFIAADVK
jgi:hypothetical protein